VPINWPIGSGKSFKGVYDVKEKNVRTFHDTEKGTKEGVTEVLKTKEEIEEHIGSDAAEKLWEELELVDGAGAEFDLAAVRAGELTPVFFGSALTNFGVEFFLQHYLAMAMPPSPRIAAGEEIDPYTHGFTSFVFKIQANMDKNHRDRIAFLRICSGKYEADKNIKHIQSGREMRLSQPTQMMADERKIIEEAYAGDIIGVFDPGIFSIGDTISSPAEKVKYEGIPTFAPEHFARVRQTDTMKRKQFVKGVTQIAQEGAIQIFQEMHSGMEEIIVGVVGVLQFDVLKYRLNNEYNVEIRMEQLPYEYIRWIKNENVDLDSINGTSDMKKVRDLKGNPLLLFVNSWSVGMTLDRNEGLILEEFNDND
jgi:peptide chain release factor 3